MSRWRELSETDRGRRLMRAQFLLTTAVGAYVYLRSGGTVDLTGYLPLYSVSAVGAGLDVAAMGVKRGTTKPAVIEAEADLARAQNGG